MYLRSKGTPTRLDLVHFGFADCFCFFQLVGFRLLCAVFVTSWTYETCGFGNARNNAIPSFSEKRKEEQCPYSFGSSRDCITSAKILQLNSERTWVKNDDVSRSWELDEEIGF